MATATPVTRKKITGGSFLIEERQLDEVFTPEDFTDEHLQIAQTTDEFALKEIVPAADKLEKKDWALTRELLKKASDLDLLLKHLAEAGIEQALWALANPEAPNGLPDPLPATVPPPYDGSRLVVVAAAGAPLGGFRLAVVAGAAQNERNVLSVGWVPTDDRGDNRLKAHQRISGTLWRLRVPAESAPCALCVRGDLDITDQMTVDARADRRCGGKRGAWSSGKVTVASSAKILGADGNDAPNEAGDYVQSQPADAALGWLFTEADLVALAIGLLTGYLNVQPAIGAAVAGMVIATGVARGAFSAASEARK